MTEDDLQQYLHTHIPLSAAMDVSVDTIGLDSVRLSAPLAPNINHRDSVFGGSASSVAVLAAWAFLHLKIRAAGIAATLVIRKNTMTYDKPILGTFFADAGLQNTDDWSRFVAMLTKKGKARIMVTSVLTYDGEPAGTLDGEFVAVTKKAGA